jgi:hypothetical protein
MVYGPDRVIVVSGINKISKDTDESIKRIKDIAVKKNCERLDWDTPCRLMDRCIDCKSEKRMCGVTTIHEFQTMPGRITIILIDEELGY